MTRYILKRLGYMLVTMWVIITVTFFLMNTLPGDPIEIQLRKLPPDVKANIKAQYGLDLPVHQRYVVYLKNLITKGDLGESIVQPGEKANEIIHERFPASCRLGLQSVFVGFLIGMILGILAAFNRNTWIDYIVMVVAILGVSIPNFVVAALLQKTFGGLLPVAGWPSRHIWTSGLKYTILPSIALSFNSVATYARYMRTSVLDVVNQDYILTAKAKGVPKVAVIWKHTIRNAILPIITILGPQIAGIITGTFVIERMFSVPGLGEYYVESIENRDYTIIMATTIFFAFLFIVSLLVVDLLYGLIDPRIRVTGEKR